MTGMTEPMRSLHDEVSEITDRLDRLTGYDKWLDVSHYGQRLERLEEYVGSQSMPELAAEVDRLREELEDTTSDTGQAATTIRDLAERVRLLERRLRVTGQVPVVDLDHWPQAVTTLAKTVRAGRDAEEDILYVWQRDRWLVTIQQPDALRETIRSCRAEAARAARRLAGLDYADQAGWHEAIAAWNSAAVDAAHAATEDLKEAVQDAAAARVELDAATERNNIAHPKVQRGEKALAALQTRIRTRIREAVRDEMLFPTWFDTILGSGPPTTNTARWLDLVVRVVTYRLVTNTTDPVLAFGERPASGWQRKDYDTLDRECRTLRHG